ncbi:hypothetical protein [Geotoga petraea]|uniref:hypothetical protein n=1 Tax=Geotoga petraea TaxID=28234 RepID=UPI00115F7ABA|nr:hypothetical protein [Geotoga petraea]
MLFVDSCWLLVVGKKQVPNYKKQHPSLRGTQFTNNDFSERKILTTINKQLTTEISDFYSSNN